jgi:predicted Rossmann fold nucleotide-binding protein DprA/Smf involved in DNA uptake
LLPAEAVRNEQKKSRAAAGLNLIEQKIYKLLTAKQTPPMAEIVGMTGLNSGEVLATLFELEIRDILRRLPGKQFRKVSYPEEEAPSREPIASE